MVDRLQIAMMSQRGHKNPNLGHKNLQTGEVTQSKHERGSMVLQFFVFFDYPIIHTLCQHAAAMALNVV